ncbi:aminotransferase class IV [Haoranjiania flava]|uniref:Aminotransferase class IV n=1 Tax=Haoranjiania flava TaxID=1856322 RepID=A0AAE3IKC8_9BACT|nr:aminotransferase class IV [Haoranjiania flava]MCU7693369.1 aminotransferase class IV [Haoranjiania flava]
MYRFIESIRYGQGRMPLLSLHQQRFELTQRAAFGAVLHPPLEQIICKEAANISFAEDTVYKCRVVYSLSQIDITFEKYARKVIERLRIKIDDTIDYSYKYEDRSKINKHLTNVKENEDILIVKKNLLTDSSFANIALYDGVRWFTPKYALLEGVQRRHLLSTGKIFTKDIYMKDLPKFEKIKLFNALVNWEEAWQLNISDILL